MTTLNAFFTTGHGSASALDYLSVNKMRQTQRIFANCIIASSKQTSLDYDAARNSFLPAVTIQPIKLAYSRADNFIFPSWVSSKTEVNS